MFSLSLVALISQLLSNHVDCLLILKITPKYPHLFTILGVKFFHFATALQEIMPPVEENVTVMKMLLLMFLIRTDGVKESRAKRLPERMQQRVVLT